MLCIKDDLFAVTLKIGKGLFNHPKILLQGGAENLGDMHIPALAEDGHSRGAGADKGPDVFILLDRDMTSTGRAEGNQTGITKIQHFNPFEKLHVFGIRAGITGFNIIHTQPVQRPHNIQFILHREGNAFPLGAIPEGGIQYLDFFGHVICPFRDFSNKKSLRLQETKALASVVPLLLTSFEKMPTYFRIF